MLLLFAIIFASGGAILALELLASRVMTPYFGVSLYIWTGILSITLVSLALGYWAGGRLAAREVGPGAAARLTHRFALMPAVAAIGILAACLVYPFFFAPLATASLVLGAFAACLILLFLPLVVTSAMNPLLVAIALQRPGGHSGDAGAGRVFFVSTIGSVAGVLATAFGLIPYVSNYTALLVVALVLGGLSLLAAGAVLPRRTRAPVAGIALAAVLGSALLLWRADAYTGRLGPAQYGASDYRVEASLGSLYGTVKILKSTAPDANGRYARIYFQDGLVQNTVDSSGRSLSFYTYALEALARAYEPQASNALALGLGAGIVPRALAARGMAVDAVEIDPVSIRIAEHYFGLDPARVHLHQADARAFLHRCPKQFDVIVVDLFHGDGTPDYLVTREFFTDLRRCLASDGVAIFNTFADLDHPELYAHLLVTLRTALPHLVLYRPDWRSPHINSFIVAGKAPLPAPQHVTLPDVPARHEATLWEMLARPIAVDATLLEGGRVITDAHNAAARDFALSQMDYRRTVVRAMPAAFLLN